MCPDGVDPVHGRILPVGEIFFLPFSLAVILVTVTGAKRQ